MDAAIRQTDELIAKLQQIKAGLLHDLLTRGLDEAGRLRDPEAHPEQFKETALGRLPAGWEILELERCVHSSITYGIVQAGPHIEGGVPYIRTGDMTDGKLDVDTLQRTSRDIADSYARSEVRAGEIVCAIRATVGNVLQIPPELDGANLTQGTARIAPKTEIDNRFLLWFMRSSLVQQQFDMYVKGTTFREITLGRLRGIKVAIPSNRNEQELIAEILDTHEERIRTEEAYRDKLTKLKQALMQDLLAGRVRTTDIAPHTLDLLV